MVDSGGVGVKIECNGIVVKYFSFHTDFGNNDEIFSIFFLVYIDRYFYISLHFL